MELSWNGQVVTPQGVRSNEPDSDLVPIRRGARNWFANINCSGSEWRGWARWLLWTDWIIILEYEYEWSVMWAYGENSVESQVWLCVVIRHVHAYLNAVAGEISI